MVRPALLARIHRYTLNRLRAEINPVSPADFMRFLFTWQHLTPASRLTGVDGLRSVIATLDGFELAASAWERAVLPARVDGYQPSMLDTLCLAGDAGWARLSVPTSTEAAAAGRLGGTTPLRCSFASTAMSGRPCGTLVTAATRRRSSNSLGKIRATKKRLPTPLSASGRARSWRRYALAAHRFSASWPLRVAWTTRTRQPRWASWSPPDWSRRTGSRDCARSSARLQAAPPFAMGGRLGGPVVPAPTRRPGRLARGGGEAQAWALLRRYGVVFRRLLTREANAAPWRELARTYRRLEARGEIRGGRFVSGMSGEQFALPDAVSTLREIRRTPADGRLITISAADPLNVTGIITAGERVRAIETSRIVYRDGVPMAALQGDYLRPLTPIADAIAADVASALTGRRMPAVTSGFVGA